MYKPITRGSSYPVAWVKARDFVVNACTEGEGYRFSIRAAHWHTDGRRDEGEGGGRRKAAQLKRVFCPSPVRIARSLVALAGCAAGCAVAPSSPFLTRSDFSSFRKAGSLARRCEAHTHVAAVSTRYPYNHFKDNNGEGISLYPRIGSAEAHGTAEFHRPPTHATQGAFAQLLFAPPVAPRYFRCRRGFA